jgi:hypothetical protein
MTNEPKDERPIEEVPVEEIEANPRKHVKTTEDFFKALNKILND